MKLDRTLHQGHLARHWIQALAEPGRASNRPARMLNKNMHWQTGTEDEKTISFEGFSELIEDMVSILPQSNRRVANTETTDSNGKNAVEIKY
jgi:hypothetical protein